MNFFGSGQSEYVNFENNLWRRINPNQYESVNTVIIIGLLKSSLLTSTQLAAIWDFMFKSQPAQSRSHISRGQFSILLKLVASSERDVPFEKVDFNSSFYLPTFKFSEFQDEEWNPPEGYMDEIADKHLRMVATNETNLINGQDVRNVIQSEQLVIPNMASIWALFDCDSDGKLDEVEFVAFFAFCKFMTERNLAFPLLLPNKFLSMIRTGQNIPPRKYKKKSEKANPSSLLMMGGVSVLPVDGFQQLSISNPQSSIPSKLDGLAHNLEHYVNLFKLKSSKLSSVSVGEVSNEMVMKIDNVQNVFNEFNLDRADKAEVWDAFNLPHKKFITFNEFMAIVRKLNEKLTFNKLFDEKESQIKSVQNMGDLSQQNKSLFEEFLKLKSEMIVLKEMGAQHTVLMGEVNKNKEKSFEVDSKIERLQQENSALRERLSLLEQNHNSILKMVDELNLLASEQNSFTSQDFNSKMFGIKKEMAPLIEQKNKLLKSETSNFSMVETTNNFMPVQSQSVDPFAMYAPPQPASTSNPPKYEEHDPFFNPANIQTNFNTNANVDPFGGFAQPSQTNNDLYDPFA